MSDLKTTAARRDFPLYPELEKVLREQISDTAFITPEGWLSPAGGGKPSMSALISSFKHTLKQTEDWKRGGRNHMKKLPLLRPAYVDVTDEMMEQAIQLLKEG